MNQPSDKHSLPDWLRPGIWVRNKLAPYMGRAFVMFVNEGECVGGFRYHLERPFKNHVRDQGWQTGGTVYAAGVEGWEPVEATLPPAVAPGDDPAVHGFTMRDAIKDGLPPSTALVRYDDYFALWQQRSAALAPNMDNSADWESAFAIHMELSEAIRERREDKYRTALARLVKIGAPTGGGGGGT